MSSSSLYVPCPCIKEYIYYVTNQQMHISNLDIYVSMHHDTIYENDQQDATV
jgi:hypothetical protein